MIFVTVGTQLPFPRLLEAVDSYAAASGEEVVAQVGQDPESRSHVETHAMLLPVEFNELFLSARVIVAHAGIGTILSAKRYCRPLVVMPRRYALGEHRNDHQSATAKALAQMPGIHVAREAADLERLLSGPSLAPATNSPGPSHPALLEGLTQFIMAPRRQRQRPLRRTSDSRLDAEPE